MKEISDRMTNLTPADTTSAAGSREAAWEGWKKAEWSQIPLPSREMQPEQGTPWQPVQERGALISHRGAEQKQLPVATAP